MPTSAPDAYSVDLMPTHGGSPYRVFVFRPDSPAPAEGWPLLCMTDGNAVFGTAVDAARAQATWPSGTDVEPGVIVAIGYPTPKPYDPFRRSWDLTPPPGSSYPPFVPGGPAVSTGGAALFLRFIVDDLLPWIGEQAPIDQRRTNLFGHSFGGLFALYAMFMRPALFRTYFAVSPSISWEDSALRPMEDAFFAGPLRDHDIRLYLSAGAYEGRQLAPFYEGRSDAADCMAHQEKIATVDMARALAERVTALKLPSLRARFELFAGETHMSVPTAAVGRAVQIAFSLSWSRLSST